jgi:hypothetical protein
MALRLLCTSEEHTVLEWLIYVYLATHSTAKPNVERMVYMPEDLA